MSRTIVIGDLHGCYDEALELLDKVGATSSDRIIFTGDLVDRGPKRRECVELAMQHESILGNHEEKHLQQRRRKDADLIPDHLETRQVLGPEHLDYFATLPHFILLPEHNAAVVHAGVLPGKTLEQQDSYHLLHAQCVRPPERKSFWPSKAPADYRFWTHHWKGPERVIFGHTVFDRPLVTEYAVGIDTGCVYGRSLTAVVLPTWELVSVPARQSYRGGKDVALLPVHGDVNVFS
jgi:diadenosine tetraphosphatase ApaH/serine/threonine PP2A family protein phosphatase